MEKKQEEKGKRNYTRNSGCGESKSLMMLVKKGSMQPDPKINLQKLS